MSNHPIEQDELMAYLDGELEAARAAEAASHLKQCLECQKLAAQLQEVSQMLVAWQVEESEEAIPIRLTAELDAPQKIEDTRVMGNWRNRRWFTAPRRFVLAGGAAAILLLVLAVSISNLRRSSPSAEYSQLWREKPQAPTRANQSPGSAVVAQKAVQGLPDAFRSSGSSTSQDINGNGIGTAGRLVKDGAQTDQETAENLPASAPMIIPTADLGVVVKEFEKARSSVDEILKRHSGHVGELSVSNPTGAARSLSGTLRIPSNQLDAALSDLKALGRVEKESQGGEEVTQQYVDLQARLSNAKHTEQRLIEIQSTRTGKLSDVLAVEVQIGRVRGEIEQMEAERKNMKNQVDFATLNLTVVEDFKAELKVGPPSTGTQFRNAAIGGFESLANGIISVLLWLLSVGPTLLLWVAILFFPVRFLWRKVRPRLMPSK